MAAFSKSVNTRGLSKYILQVLVLYHFYGSSRAKGTDRNHRAPDGSGVQINDEGEALTGKSESKHRARKSRRSVKIDDEQQGGMHWFYIALVWCFMSVCHHLSILLRCTS